MEPLNVSTSENAYNHITPFEQDENHNYSNGQMCSTGGKVLYLLNNALFNWHLGEKMRSQGYYDSYPILKVQCKVTGFLTDNYVLDSTDLHEIFERFGKLDRILMSSNKKTGYALFRSYHSAYVACKFLDKTSLHKHNIELVVSWLKAEEYE